MFDYMGLGKSLPHFIILILSKGVLIMQTVTLTIDGMTCAGCAKSITNVLLKLQGVHTVEVSHMEGKAELSFDEDKISIDTLVEAIEDAGYDVIK